MTFDPFSLLQPAARRTKTLQKGERLFVQGEPTSGLYQVLSGSIMLQRMSIDGDVRALHRAAAGGYFAEASIFSDVYHCDAICSQTGHFLKIGKAEIIAAMKTNPAFCESFMKLLAMQVQSYRSLIEILAIRSAKERVLTAFRAGYFEGTIIEFANRINLTHETCYRALRALVEDGQLRRIGQGQYQLV